MSLKRTESSHRMSIEEMTLKMQQNIPECSDTSSAEEVNDQFEVERLLKHRIKNGELMFFVKWKDFNNRHNSWVKQSNLSCKKILHDYLKRHELK